MADLLSNPRHTPVSFLKIIDYLILIPFYLHIDYLYDMARLTHLIRYIKCMEIRLQRALVDFEKDQAKQNEVRPFADKLNHLVTTLSLHASDQKRNAIEEFFWMLEEFKVSVFAQELKTAVPVSAKRLQQKLKQIERMR